MAVEQKQFPMINPGMDNDPDFHAGPNAIATSEKAIVKKRVSETPTDVVVDFQRFALKPQDPEKLRADFLAGRAAWNAASNLAQARAAGLTMFNAIAKFLSGMI